MSRGLGTAVTLALCAAVAAGCGLGPGEGKGDVELTVTRNYGRQVLLRETEPVSESDTVLRVLDRNADVTTRYGGGFVQSIDGLAGGESEGRRSDWFFYVNGIESPVGSAAYRPSGGEAIWWDYRDWTSAMRVPAVVGSWPEPFIHGFQGKRYQVAVDCEGIDSACDQVSQRLQAAGIRSTEADAPSPGKLNISVGTWNQLRSDSVVQLLARGPAESGVFARFVGRRHPRLEAETIRGESAGSVAKGAGLVAALRPGDGPPTWVVTGTDESGVEAAAATLGEKLQDHFAVVFAPGPVTFGVPVP